MSGDTPTPEQPYIDHEWLNGDPVWPIFRGLNPKRLWTTTYGPQTIAGSILMGDTVVPDDKLEVCGTELALYGSRYVPRGDLFPTQKIAEEEAERRNALERGASDE